MNYCRMAIEMESPEQMGYNNIKFNLTESSVTDVKLADLNIDLKDLLIAYGDHIGHPQLRQLIAEDAGVQIEDVLLTVGAANALFIISTSLLGKGDRILVEHPNYATNLETPRAIGAFVDLIELKFEKGFCPSMTEIESEIKDGETKLVSITVPHNPTGTIISRAQLDELIFLTKKHKINLLVDETYRDMTFGELSPVAASLAPHVISVSSLSKSYGLPGIRLGWIICQQNKLMEKFLAAKEQMVICGSVIDEQISYQSMLTRKQQLTIIKAEIQLRFHIVKQWIDEHKHYLEWVEPQGGVVCFPRIKPNINIELFYQILNGTFGTFVGPGHWFQMDQKFMRIGYGWSTREQLKQGLDNIIAALDICLKNNN